MGSGADGVSPLLAIHTLDDKHRCEALSAALPAHQQRGDKLMAAVAGLLTAAGIGGPKVMTLLQIWLGG
jgi:hypothetical protein